MSLSFKEYKFRPSQLPDLMTGSTLKSEILGETAKSTLREIYIKAKYGREKIFTNKFLQKGIIQENESIALYNQIFGTNHIKNEEKISNAYLQGTPDIKSPLIDIKSSWDLDTFFSVDEKKALKDYRWQLVGYADILGVDKAQLAYCLVSTTESLIFDELRRLKYSFGLSDEDPQLSSLEDQLMLNMTYEDIPPQDRIKIFDIQITGEDRTKLHAQLDACREYLELLNLDKKVFGGAVKDTTQLSFVQHLGSDLDIENKIISKYREFGIQLAFVEKIEGASIIQYRFEPLGKGVKIEKAGYYTKDIQALFESDNVRILTPIFGTGLIGIEFVKDKKDTLELSTAPKLAGVKFSIGRTVENKDYIVDFNESTSPHMIVAGTTGSGKTIFLNSMLNQLEANTDPKNLKTIIIDPKNEFSDRKFKNGFAVERISEIEYLLDTVIKNMDHRYGRVIEDEFELYKEEKILIIVEELADLLGHKEKKEITEKSGSKDKLINGVVIAMDQFITKQIPLSEVIQNQIQRIAQKGRAAGIHLVICTQNPLSREIGSTLKANLPVSVSFRVKTETNSKVVLDFAGAEKLTGNGDGLIIDSKQKEPLRFQSYYTK